MPETTLTMPNMLPDVTCADLIRMVKKGNVLNAPPEVLLDILLREGDDCLDCWQGIYWTIKNLFLLEKPLLSNVRRTGTIIACGSGPSLTDHLDSLRGLQDSAYIIAAESTTELLIKNGIYPHMVTPLERIDVRAHCLDGSYERAAYAGSIVVPHEPHKFDHHYCLMNPTPMQQWTQVQGLVPLSPLSGGQSLINAMVLASDNTAEVYMVGHDLCLVDGADHAAGYDHEFDHRMMMEVECFDGQKRMAHHEWVRAAHHIENCHKKFGRGRFYSVSEKGCKICGAEVKSLPDPAMAITGVETVLPGAMQPVDIGRLRRLVRHLPHNLEAALEKAKRATNIRQLDPDVLIENDNQWLLSYLLQPLYAQMSIERLGQFGNKGSAVDWFAEAFENVYNGLYRSIREVADVDGAE